MFNNMESTKHTLSVIEKLMGLDDQLPQLPVRERRRVLSENYLEKSAMLGTCERRMLYSCHSSSISTCKKKLRQSTSFSVKEHSWSKVDGNKPSFANGSSVGRSDGKRIFDKWRKMKTAEATKLSDVRRCIGEILIPMDEHCNSSSTPKASQYIIESGSDSSVDEKGSKLCYEEPKIFPCNDSENDNTLGHVIYRLSSDLDRDSDIKLPLEGGQEIHDGNECHLEKSELLEESSLVKSIPSYISEAIAADHQRNEISISPSEFQELLSATLLNHDSPLEVPATSSVQTSPYYFNEEGFDISDFTRVDSEFPRKSRDINQPSPDSVLEPHLLEEDTLVFEGLESDADDFCGFAMQFHCLNSKSEETYSDGSELVVSGDEDSEDVSYLFSYDTQKILEVYGNEESRNFSYLLDILDEAELTCIKSEHYLNAWQSLVYPVDPSIFEVLEKKYGKQTSWEKSERRLLFDRINVGLKEIFSIQIGICSFETPLRRSFTGTLQRNELEEELWMFLTGEEKDACTNLSVNGLGNETKWLQLSEVIQTICRDIEYDLFSEIVGEAVTILGS